MTNIGWICPRCGAANAPQNTLCGAPTCGDAVPQLTDAVPQQQPQVPVAVEVLDPKASKPSTSKNRFNYNDQGFTDFWNAYPLHKGKAAAFKRWGEAVAAGISPQLMVEGALRYRNECAANPDRLVKYAEGWLHDGRWDDDSLPAHQPAVKGANLGIKRLIAEARGAEA